MAITHLGELALSAIIPGLNTAVTTLQAEAAQLTAMINDKNSQVSDLSAGISGLQSVVSQSTSILNQANALLGLANNAVTNSNTVVADLAADLAAAGISLYSWAGQINQMSSDVASQLTNGVPGGTGGTQQGFGLILVTTDAGAWNSISKVLKVH